MSNSENMWTILLVDDDANFRAGLVRLFHSMRHELPSQILQAAQGAEALKLVADRSVACLLLDYNMPGGNGLYWLRQLLAARPDLAIIMITGEGDEAVAVEAMKNGAMDYLVKGTMSPEALRRAVTNALQKKAMAQTIRKQQAELLAAERQRVMIQSLGAACHHLGQPATVMATYLELMRRKERSPELLAMINECLQAADAMGKILRRLQEVSEYRTVPYRPAQPGEPSRNDEHILDISG